MKNAYKVIRFAIAAIALQVSFAVCPPTAAAVATCAFADANLVPMPQKMSAGEGFFSSKEDAYAVAVSRSTDASVPKEGYVLSVTPGGIAVKSSDDAGAFYARQTLLQLAERSGDGWRYPCVEIQDYPAFAWRGVLLDESRHFFGKETVRRVLDLMARYKLNVFHWHLIDDQGWRLDVPAYPLLAKCGSMRRRSPEHGAAFHEDKKNLVFGSASLTTERYGPFFYTADDVREILAYAKERHITVVPEVEMPGHALAALGAYPEFACFPEHIDAGAAAPDWGTFPDVFCLGSDATLKFLDDVLDYVCELFPSQVIHLGGDECPYVNWEKCPRCRARMKSAGIEKASGLQPWLTRRMAERLAKKGRRVMGWDEILNGDVPKSAIGHSWRTSSEHGTGTESLVSGATGAERGHDMVMSPCALTYYSNRQGLREDPFLRGWGTDIPLELAYTFNPLDGVPERLRKHILGGQCCIWSEYVWNCYDLAWRLWPRGFAIAEVLWTAPAKRDFAEFERRAAIERARLIKMGINCAPMK